MMIEPVSEFAGKYRIATARCRGWDYAGLGSYFVTICTRYRYPWFGCVRNGIVCMSEAGSIVADEWLKTPCIRPYVTLDAWIIMPNHLHGIITFTSRESPVDVHVVDDVCVVETPRRGVSTHTINRGVSTTQTNNQHHPTHSASGGHQWAWMPHCLGAIINQFKSVCTKRVRAMGHGDFAWQARYHDRIIRTDEQMETIRTYIHNNPRRWKEDVLYW